MKDERERPAGYVRMTKERFVERMTGKDGQLKDRLRAESDAIRDIAEAERTRQAQADLHGYLHERAGQYLHRIYRKTRGRLH